MKTADRFARTPDSTLSLSSAGLSLFRLLLLSLLLGPGVPCRAAQVLDLGALQLTLDSGNAVELRFDDSSAWRSGDQSPLLYLKSGSQITPPRSMELSDGELRTEFADGSRMRFSVEPGEGLTLFRLKSLDLRSTVSHVGLFRLPVPEGAEIAGTLNAAFLDDRAVAVMAAVPDVHAFVQRNRLSRADRTGCSHRFERTTSSLDGSPAARFIATCDSSPTGWSMHGRTYPAPVDTSAFAGVRARLHGDGQGQSFKIQFVDGKGGARDYYIPITFTGWKEVEVTSASLDTMGPGASMTGINLYYNGLPAGSTVECVIDEIHAVVRGEDGTTTTRLLEDFSGSAWWEPRIALTAEGDSRYGFDGLSFGVIASPRRDFFTTVERFEKAAGIRATYPEGVWNKHSPAVKRSYLFLTRFRESQFEAALALARRGGFRQVLILQDSWCTGTGHYDINRRSFPDGLDGLVRTVRRFREAGIETGLHVLGASIYPPDRYLTPVPDRRLLKGAQTTLAEPLDARATRIAVTGMPEDFPREDGGYNGRGCVLQIGTELIYYESLSTDPPAFLQCRRGYLGTRAQSHAAGEPVRHLVRAYGYHMHDLDTSLLDDVASNFAAVVNATDVNMVYFDGSERLQGDHWRYNARLIKAMTDRIRRTDMIYQASSFSHYSWHLLARSASADGHGDLKGYLEQRAPMFADFARNGMPLDIGWYYGYDRSATPDTYEYILGTTIGYDSSMSYQVSVDAAASHPFTDEILDLIARYERLRLSGRVPEHLRQLLRVHPGLLGLAPEAPDRPNELRRDYRLLEKNGTEVFQRVVYDPWRELDEVTTTAAWEIQVTTGPAEIGFQLQVVSGPTTGTPGLVRLSVNGERIEWSGELSAGHYLFAWPGEPFKRYGPAAGQTIATGGPTPVVRLPAGTHRIELIREGSALSPMRVRTTLQPPESHAIAR